MIQLNKKYFRPGTKHESCTINFALQRGGIGDYVNWLCAFEYIIKEHPHVKVKVLAPAYFIDIARYFLKPWGAEVYPREQAQQVIKKGELVCDPGQFTMQINATGAHLMDLGFMLYACQQKAIPGYDKLPQFNFKSYSKKISSQLPKNFAVFTPGYTADARKIPAKHFNELISYTKSLGITPVFLGKKDFAKLDNPDSDYKGKFDETYNYDQGLDLREKTTLLEAAEVMAQARFTIGLDNGLLHLAGCTDRPVIFGYNITTIEHRELRRSKGHTCNVALNPANLACIGCQSNMRFIIGHTFTKCVYDDYACTEMLFSNNCETWKKAINEAIKH